MLELHTVRSLSHKPRPVAEGAEERCQQNNQVITIARTNFKRCYGILHPLRVNRVKPVCDPVADKFKQPPNLSPPISGGDACHQVESRCPNRLVKVAAEAGPDLAANSRRHPVERAPRACDPLR